MPFWTVEDAGPYKERLNILMRTTLFGALFRQVVFEQYSIISDISKIYV